MAYERHDPREQAVARLRSRYGLDGEYVGAPALAKILDMGRSTVHTMMKQGRFFIPHRVVNGSPKALLDDLVDWLHPELAGAPEATPSVPLAPPPGARDEALDPRVAEAVRAATRKLRQH